MKVLAIGNSFSEDATHYLHSMAQAEGCPVKVVNLYIGGCPLSRHYANMNNDARAYAFCFNGQDTGIYVSIREALQSDEWDYVTLQQASYVSRDYATYQPYLAALSAYVTLHAPHARQVIHQTWAYEDGSDRLAAQGYASRGDMFRDVREAYQQAAQSIGASILPCGETLEQLAVRGAEGVHRDTFHAGYGLGRYALSAVWFEALTGNALSGRPFPLDEEVSPELLQIARQCAHEAVVEYGWGK